MKREEYLTEAMEQISDRYIAEAAFSSLDGAAENGSGQSEERKRRVCRAIGKRKSGKAAAVAAVCICVAVALAAVTGRFGFWGTEEKPGESGVTVSEAGVTIPPIAIAGHSENASASMILFVIYEGGVYCYYEDLPAELRGEYLATSAGGIDEWTPLSEYGELTGSAAGELYAVEGYDTGFMVGLETDEGGWMGLIRNNGITLKWGRELFADRLHLDGRYIEVQWQSREDWYEGRDNKQTFADADKAALDHFVEALCEAEFMRREDIPLPEGGDNVYDSLEICHLFFRMEDGLIVELRCFAGGYVSFSGIPEICVQIPEDLFQAVCGAF